MSESTRVPTTDEPTDKIVHLFRGHYDPSTQESVVDGFITLCCHIAAIDTSMKGELGTVDPDLVTCPSYTKEI